MAIVLVTDFGTRDPYVAAVKGVIASRCDAAIVDLTHEIAPFDVWEGAFFLRACQRFWAAGTIFVCVVDPGVGTPRRIVAAESDGRVFLAPDNGLLTFVNASRVVSVENESLFLPNGSTTFHGRDRFAPVAAALASGLPFDDLGPRVDAIVRLDYTPGCIVGVDRFGNCITDVAERGVALRAGGVTIGRLSTTYEGEGPFLIVGSSGALEISMANASAADVLHLTRGDRVEIVRR